MDEERRANGEKKPTAGEASPRNPADRMPNGEPKEPDADNPQERNDNVPPWFAALPPEIRDAFSGGRYADIPAKYRPLIELYNLFLQKAGR